MEFLDYSEMQKLIAQIRAAIAPIAEQFEIAMTVGEGRATPTTLRVELSMAHKPKHP